ncbi:protein kinase [Streptomyces sp. NBRC 110611]|nr:protein kinase [Streptomyces sp. NBRC 110611]
MDRASLVVPVPEVAGPKHMVTARATWFKSPGMLRPRRPPDGGSPVSRADRSNPPTVLIKDRPAQESA